MTSADIAEYWPDAIAGLTLGLAIGWALFGWLEARASGGKPPGHFDQ